MQNAGMHVETIHYFHGASECRGFIAYDEKAKEKRPAVLVAPAWRGQDEFARQKAVALAELGYVGFAVDIYGEGRHTDDNLEASKLMAPFFLDRILLQGRIQAAFEALRKQPQVDRDRIGAIGFCFGGLCVFELLRGGADVKGVVSFHGVFMTEREGKKASLAPLSPKARGKLLILHGHQDPMVSEEDLHRVQSEMTEAQIDWQIHTYGLTMHAFTNPEANAPQNGILYNQISAMRAWKEMETFFMEVL
ncbi:MAG: hypothetical protein KR126chlam1_00302 [Chlamydiae bacterium]|nr:hypothetical protein [Chlamydiota bacterium]